MFVQRADSSHMRVEAAAVEDDLEGPRLTRQDLPSKQYDSLDYDVCYNVPYKRMLRGYGRWTYVHTTLMRWVVVAIIGCLTGFTGFVIQFLVLKLWAAKLNNVFDVVYNATISRGTVVLGFLALLGVNVACALVSSLASAVQPVSAGSGVPEVKCYLNGVKIPNVVKARTFIAKVVGSIFTVSAEPHSMCPWSPIPCALGAPFHVPLEPHSMCPWSPIPCALGAPFHVHLEPHSMCTWSCPQHLWIGVSRHMYQCLHCWECCLMMRVCSMAGFVAGKQDPMVHIGAIIGAGIPQLRSMLLCFKKIKFPYSHFRSDRDKRDFVSCGAAAGMAAAFGAPIGGTLFALEEGSSFWNQGLTWRTLFCAFCATYTLNLLRSGVEQGVLWNVTQSTGLVNFGSFGRTQTDSWTLLHLLCFVSMGIFGGLSGAVFNSINTRVTVYRMKYLKKRRCHTAWRVLEALLCIIATSLLLYVCAMFFGTCAPVNMYNIPKSWNTPVRESYSYFCPHNETSHYMNDMASLLFQPMEFVVRNLFHNPGPYSLSTLGISFFLYFFLACFMFGIGVSGGLFMPCLVIGATYGRFLATVLTSSEYTYFNSINFGTYALIGAASFLAGVMRMSLSLTVILMESTQDITFGLPILFTVMVAKWVGDLFNTGIYHIHITLKRIPHLDGESPYQMNRLVAEDVMHADFSYLFPITRVRSVVTVLRVSSSSAFPVVRLDHRTSVTQDTVGQHTPFLYSLPRASLWRQNEQMKKKQKVVLCGMILRSQLIMLLKGKVFFNERVGPAAQREVSYDEMMADYPRSDDIFKMEFTDEEKEQLMDLSLYMNPSLYCVSSQTPLYQVFNLFRTMGLRHLPVLNEASHNLVGIVTRFDLTHEKLHELRQRKRKGATENDHH
eukprot:Em0008g480a